MRTRRMYTVMISLQITVDNHFLAFMNSTSWVPLRGMTTLLSVRDAVANGTSHVPEGSALRDEHFVITEDDVQVVDLLIVRTITIAPRSPFLRVVASDREVEQPGRRGPPVPLPRAPALHVRTGDFVVRGCVADTKGVS